VQRDFNAKFLHLLSIAGVPKLGYNCLSEGVRLRLAIEGKNKFIHYSFQVI